VPCLNYSREHTYTRSRLRDRCQNLPRSVRVAGTYRYYLTKAGRAATAATARPRHTTIVPSMI
jgi:hypothetical protein